jgi:branched-subunit amino acid ABC-type transport system permease component
MSGIHVRLYSATLSPLVNGDGVALVLQVLITGLAAGAGYGLVAIGLALIYRLTGVVHFALGELVGLAIFAALLISAGTGPITRTNVSAGRYVFGLAAALAVAIGTGVLVYLVAVRPFLLRGSMVGWIGGVVAVAFAVRGLVAATFTRQSYVFPDPLPFGRLPNGGVLVLDSGVAIQVRTFFVIAVGMLLAAVAWWLLERTRPGKALRAVAEDPEAARTVGLPVDRLLAAAFGLAGALAVLAAAVQAPAAPVTTDTGALIGLNGLVAAVVARFGSPWRAFAAGLAVGVVETGVSSLHLGGLRLGPAYGDILPLVLAVLFIAIRGVGRERAQIE